MLAPALPWAALRAPLGVAPGGYAWFPPVALGDRDPGRATDAAWQWIDANLTPDAKVAAVGFSQGGLMATQLLRTRPERVAATVVLSGFVQAAPQPADEQLTARRPAVFWGRGARAGPAGMPITARRWTIAVASATTMDHRRCQPGAGGGDGSGARRDETGIKRYKSGIAWLVCARRGRHAADAPRPTAQSPARQGTRPARRRRPGDHAAGPAPANHAAARRCSVGSCSGSVRRSTSRSMSPNSWWKRNQVRWESSDTTNAFASSSSSFSSLVQQRRPGLGQRDPRSLEQLAAGRHDRVRLRVQGTRWAAGEQSSSDDNLNFLMNGPRPRSPSAKARHRQLRP